MTRSLYTRYSNGSRVPETCLFALGQIFIRGKIRAQRHAVFAARQCHGPDLHQNRIEIQQHPLAKCCKHMIARGVLQGVSIAADSGPPA
jgi:hypothetical protein